MKGSNVILAIAVCVAVFQMKLVRSSSVVKRHSTAALDLKEQAMAQKRERQIELEQETSIAQDADRFPVPMMFNTTEAQQKAFGDMSREELALQKDPSILFFIGETFVYLHGEVIPIKDGKIKYKTFDYVICSLTAALDSEFLCCKKVLINKAAGLVACCNDIFYYTNAEICCGEYFYPKSVGQQRIGCCSAQAFLSGTESCCEEDTTIVEQPTCPAVCNAGPREICCEGRVYPKLRYLKCCPGDRAYITLYQSCCDSKVVFGRECPR